MFTFRDLRDQPEGTGGVDGVWHLLEEQANHTWNYGAGSCTALQHTLSFPFCKIFPGQPLYRHLLWRVSEGYFAVNCYHHAAGDGSTGPLAMKGIFERYSKLTAGEKVDFPPNNRMGMISSGLLLNSIVVSLSSLRMDTLVQVEETSLEPMESVEGITSAVQLDSAEAKVENIQKVLHAPSRNNKVKGANVLRLKSSCLPWLSEERTTGRW